MKIVYNTGSRQGHAPEYKFIRSPSSGRRIDLRAIEVNFHSLGVLAAVHGREQERSQIGRIRMIEDLVPKEHRHQQENKRRQVDQGRRYQSFDRMLVVVPTDHLVGQITVDRAMAGRWRRL